MSANSFGKLFKITTFGESHGKAIGCVIDGCPSNISITQDEIQQDLNLRRPGQSEITTDRKEYDKVEILSGIFEGKTTGTPICLIIYNQDQQSNDYLEIKDIFRPSHADYVYEMKYGIRDYRGGGRSSARETIARVAAGAIARKILNQMGIEILSWVEQVYNIKANINLQNISRKDIFNNIIRCPDEKKAQEMINLITKMKDDGDSVGGIIKGVIRNCPVGLGNPVFEKLNSQLGNAMLTINAVKGFDIGDGFDCVNLKGSEHNDELILQNGNIETKTNHAGGIVGGLSNGEDIVYRLAFKPVSTIKKPQNSINKFGENIHIETIKGRHDPCVLPRAIPIVDAMAMLVILDNILLNNSFKINEKSN